MATLVSQKAYDQEVASGSRTTESATPALGDLIWCCMNNSVGTDAALTGCGMAWTLRQLIAGASSYGALFEATSGTPSAGQLTHTTSDTGRDYTYQWVRPGSGLTYNTNANSSTSGASLTVDLAALVGTVGELIAFGHQSVDGVTFATDSGWTKLGDVQTDDPVTAAEGSCSQYRTTDDSEWICDPSGSGIINAVVVELIAAPSSSTGKLAGQYVGLVRQGGSGPHGGIVCRTMDKINGIIRPRRLVVPVGISLQGA